MPSSRTTLRKYIVELVQVSQFHWENLKVQKLAESKDGHELLALIKETLQFYNMDYTLNIYNSEANVKEEIKREELISRNNLKGKVADDKPVLFHMFQQFMKSTGVKAAGKPATLDKDSKGQNRPQVKGDSKTTGLSKEKQAVSKAQEVVKKNSAPSAPASKIPDLPVQKKAAPKEDQDLQEQILKNQSRKMGDSQVFGDSQGYDMSVDSLQLQDYDYFENIVK